MRPSLVEVGGRFMVSPEMEQQAAPLGLQGGVLALRGRAAGAGEVSPAVAAALLGIFPPGLIDGLWRHTASIPAQRAGEAYAAACAAWGENHLADLEGAGRAAALAERVCDAADAGGLPLFAGWRSRPRPEAAAARTAHALMLLRELRGAIHFAALRVAGIEIPVAQAVEPNGGAARLAQTGWRPEQAEGLLARAAADTDLEERWKGAEQTTEAAFGRTLGLLDEAQREQLVAFVARAEAATRLA